MNLANKIWAIAYPVLMYYVAITMGSFVAQIIFGTGVEQYMLCKIIGSIVAIPVVFADYKKDFCTGLCAHEYKIHYLYILIFGSERRNIFTCVWLKLKKE